MAVFTLPVDFQVLPLLSLARSALLFRPSMREKMNSFPTSFYSKNSEAYYLS